MTRWQTTNVAFPNSSYIDLHDTVRTQTCVYYYTLFLELSFSKWSPRQLHIPVKKGKDLYICFYIAQYPVRWTAQSALHFSSPARPVHSDTNLASLGSILAMQAMCSNCATTIHSHFHRWVIPCQMRPFLAILALTPSDFFKILHSCRT